MRREAEELLSSGVRKLGIEAARAVSRIGVLHKTHVVGVYEVLDGQRPGLSRVND